MPGDLGDGFSPIFPNWDVGPMTGGQKRRWARGPQLLAAVTQPDATMEDFSWANLAILVCLLDYNLTLSIT